MGAGQPGDAEAPLDGDQLSADEADFEGGTDRGGTDQAGSNHDIERSADSRSARPEMFEHAFGAQAHPAEPAVKDPAPTPTVSPSGSQADQSPANEPTSSDPSATPEQ